jgi:hypothetical protein
MKRDMDLIRLLLLQTEREEPVPDLSAFTEEQQVYHSALTIEAGLVHGRIMCDGQGQPRNTVTLRLSWKGHEFLDAARNETIWRKAAEKTRKAGIQVTVAVLEELLKKLLKDQIGLP